MSLDLVKHIVTRELADMRWLFGNYYDADTLEQQWHDIQGRNIRTVRGGMFALFREQVQKTETAINEQLDGIPPDKKPFSTPTDYTGRTNILVSAIEAIDQMQSNEISGDPHDINDVAEEIGRTAQELRTAIATLFVVPNPSWELFLQHCGVKEVTVPPIAPDAERPYDKTMDTILRTSLEKQSLPTEAEAEKLGYASLEDLKQAVQTCLLTDAQAVTARFVDKGWNIGHVVFNQYSHYFREYGILIYHLWFEGDLSPLHEHPRPLVEEQLKKIFDRDTYLYTSETSMVWQTSELSDDLETMLTQYNSREYTRKVGIKKPLMVLVEEYFGLQFDTKYYKSFNVRTTLYILEIWQEHKFAFKPTPVWFIRSIDKIQKYLDQLMQINRLSEELNLPYKVKMYLLNSPNLNTNRIKDRIYIYKKMGLEAEYYGPYLAVHETRMREHAVRSMLSTVCAERGLGNAPLRNHLAMLSRFTEGYGSPDRVMSIEYLEGEGYPYDSFFTYSQVIPEKLAMRIRILVNVPIPIGRKNLGSMSIEEIERRRVIYEAGMVRGVSLMQYKEGSFEAMMVERELTAPPYILGLLRPTIMERIQYIEERGIPFTAANMEAGIVAWHWINRFNNIDDHIARSTAKLHRRERWKEVVETYGIDVEHLPKTVQRLQADTFWEYVQLIQNSGLTFDDIVSSHIRDNGITNANFHVYLYDILVRRPVEQLTDQQKKFMRRYEVAKEAFSMHHWSDAQACCQRLSDRRLKNVRSILQAGGQPVKELHQRLQLEAKRWYIVTKRLLKYLIPYRQIDQLLAECTIDELEQQMEVFTAEGVVIDTDTALEFMRENGLENSLATMFTVQHPDLSDVQCLLKREGIGDNTHWRLKMLEG